MNLNNNTVFVIDDDSNVCNALQHLFESMQLKVATYKSAATFLEHYNIKHKGCIIIDVRMPNMNGLELLEQLNLRHNRLPVIMITGFGDIAMAIRVMKLGAVDIFLKPFNDNSLLESVQRLMTLPIKIDITAAAKERFKMLTKREVEILNLIAAGKLNKEIAYELAISISTVEVHRANIMRKMSAKTMAELIKFYLQAQEETSPIY